MPPRGETIGRGMKVNKEEILGMLVAVEEFVKIDHDAEALIFLERIKNTSCCRRSTWRYYNNFNTRIRKRYTYFKHFIGLQ